MGCDYKLSHVPSHAGHLGPPHTFWCFSYERMNGILAGSPNSNRCIELDVLDRFLRDFAFSITFLPVEQLPRHLREQVLTTTTHDESEIHSYPQMFTNLRAAPEKRFLYQQQVDRGQVKTWKMQFRHPCKQNIRIKPQFLRELQSFFEGLYGGDLKYVRPRITKYGRCFVNGQKFSSDFNSTDRGSVVKCMFVDGNNELSPYFGVVRFYFTITTLTQQGIIDHSLAYVTWLKFRLNK